jgi:hypothetical protein
MDAVGGASGIRALIDFSWLVSRPLAGSRSSGVAADIARQLPRVQKKSK